MPWVRIDEEFPHHPKVAPVGPLGIAMQVAALCYSNRYLTDGFLPAAMAPMLLPLDGLAVRNGNGQFEPVSWRSVVASLVETGLWEPVEGGWHIHDYHDYQPTREDVEARRVAEHDAKAAGGRARAAGAKRDRGRFTKAQVNTRITSSAPAAPPAAGQQPTSPVPVPPVGTGGSVASPGEIPQASPTARKSSAAGATITPIPTAQTFVAAYVDAYRGRAGHDPPARVKGQVAKHLREALTDGVSTDHVKAGFVEWFEDNKHPATLPSYIEIAGRNGQPRASPTRAERQVDHARQVYEEMMANASGAMGDDRRPPQPELARPDHRHPHG